MTAEEFEEFTTGQTLIYTDRSGWSGFEQYLSGRRVIWREDGGLCKLGYWYDEGERICFVYEDSEEPVCWAAFMTGEDSLTVIASDFGAIQDVTSQTDLPLNCPAEGEDT